MRRSAEAADAAAGPASLCQGEKRPEIRRSSSRNPKSSSEEPPGSQLCRLIRAEIRSSVLRKHLQSRSNTFYLTTVCLQPRFLVSLHNRTVSFGQKQEVGT